MEILTNPVTVSVIVLCVLCLLKLNVLMSLIISALVAGVMGGMASGVGLIDSITGTMGTLTNGFSVNASTGLAYVLLGTFATAIASTGLADMASKKLSKAMGEKADPCCC